jgi:hypothetical protein
LSLDYPVLFISGRCRTNGYCALRPYFFDPAFQNGTMVFVRNQNNSLLRTKEGSEAKAAKLMNLCSLLHSTVPVPLISMKILAGSNGGRTTGNTIYHQLLSCDSISHVVYCQLLVKLLKSKYWRKLIMKIAMRVLVLTLVFAGTGVLGINSFAGPGVPVPPATLSHSFAGPGVPVPPATLSTIG